MREMKMQTAIILLEANYEKAQNLEYVQRPLAWALYQTWKEVDSGKYEKRREYNRISQQKSRAKRKVEAALKGGAE